MKRFKLIVYGTKNGRKQADKILTAVASETPDWLKALNAAPGAAKIFTGKSGDFDKVYVMIETAIDPVPDIQWEDALLKETILENINIVET